MRWEVLVTAGIIVLVVIAIAFAFWREVAPVPKGGLEMPEEKEETIEGKEGVKITYWNETTGEKWAQIEYVEGGNKYWSYFPLNAKTALEWIKENTQEKSVFFCWWKYGHIIKGYTGREAIAKFPSKDWVASHPEEQLGYLDSNNTLQIGYESNEMIQDIILALTTKNEEMFLNILEKYDASYVFIYKGNENIFGYKIGGYSEVAEIFKAASLEPEEYLTGFENEKFTFTELGKETMIARLIDNREIKGLSLVYSDEFVNIYQIK